MLTQNFKLQQSQKITPHQIQTMNLIALPFHTFEERVNRELEENPVLTDTNKTTTNSDSDQKIQTSYLIKNNNSNSDNNFENNSSTSQESLSEHLLDQLNTYDLNEEQFLIGSVDSNSYLFTSLSNIAENLAFIEKVYTSEDEIQKLLDIIQRFEPAGIGAKSLQECLLNQLQRKLQTNDIKLAVNIILNSIDRINLSTLSNGIYYLKLKKLNKTLVRNFLFIHLMFGLLVLYLFWGLLLSFLK